MRLYIRIDNNTQLFLRTQMNQIKLINNITVGLYVEHLCLVFLRKLEPEQNYIPNFSILKIPNFKNIRWGKECRVRKQQSSGLVVREVYYATTFLFYLDVFFFPF